MSDAVDGGGREGRTGGARRELGGV
jgi:hypothetical protein